MKIQRNRYIELLKSREGNGQIKMITGMRRCGKSFLLFRLFRDELTGRGVPEDHILEIALDDRSNRALRDPDKMLRHVKDKIQDEQPYYILIDELQLLKEYEEVLNSFLRIENADTYAVICSSLYLPYELRSKTDEIRVYPLSFAEFMSAYEGRVSQGWDEYMFYGGLPLLFTRVSAADKEEYLATLMNQVYLPDISARYAVRSRNELEELVNMLVTSLGTLTNPLKFSETFRADTGKKVSDKTIKKFLDYFEAAFLIRKTIRYEIRSRKYINSPAKYYFADVGLRNARLKFQGLEENCIVENIIHNELGARGYQVDAGLVEIYEKDASKKFVLKRLEVDFVANRGSDRCYVQLAYGRTDEAEMNEKRRALNGIEDSFPKYILVKDDIKPRRDEKGIVTMGILHFLLDSEFAQFTRQRIEA